MSKGADFQLSDKVNKNNIFLVNISKIGGRLDSSPYRPTFYFSSYSYPIFKLSELASINPTTNIPSDLHDLSFLPMDAIDNKEGNIKYVLEKSINEITGFTKFKRGDLIWAKITPCMQNGKSAVVDGTTEFVCGSTEFFSIRPKNDLLNIHYLHFILRDKRILKTAENFFGGSAGQQRVSPVFLRNLPIPLPPIDKQEKMVEIWNNSKNTRRDYQLKSHELLSNINDYLLTELGISVPEVDNALVNRIFYTKLSTLNQRLDPTYYFNNKTQVEGGIYENILLKNIVNFIKGSSITSDSIIEGDYPVIAGGQTSPYNHNTYNFSGETITISASGAYAGYAWYHDYPIFASDCTVLTIRNKKIALIQYTFEILKLKQQEIYKLQKGAGQPHVYASDLAKIQIPLPDLPKQQEIVNHINQVRAKAKELEQQAEEILHTTNQQIEKMILGEVE